MAGNNWNFFTDIAVSNDVNVVRKIIPMGALHISTWKGVFSNMVASRSLFRTLTGVVLGAVLTWSMAACGSSEPERIVSQPDYKVYSDVTEAVRDADMIVAGRVNKVHPPQEWNINLDKSAAPMNDVYTLSNIEVIDSVKGPAPGETITIKQAGGSYKGTIYEEAGTQFVELGKEYLLFLESFDDVAPAEPYTLINPSQGMIEVNNNTIQPQNQAAFFRSSISTAQAVEELRAISATIPPKKTGFDQELIDQYRN